MIFRLERSLTFCPFLIIINFRIHLIFFLDAKKTTEFDSERDFHKLYNENPKNLEAVEKVLKVIVARGNILQISGADDKVNSCEELFSLFKNGKASGTWFEMF